MLNDDLADLYVVTLFLENDDFLVKRILQQFLWHSLCFYFAFSWPHQTFIECVKGVYWVLSSCFCFKTQILISVQGSTWRRVSHWTIAHSSWPGTDCWPRLAHSQLWRPRTEVSVFLNPGKLWDHVTSIKGTLELKYIIHFNQLLILIIAF